MKIIKSICSIAILFALAPLLFAGCGGRQNVKADENPYRFYTLTEAYALGLLTQNNIKDISYYYSGQVVDAEGNVLTHAAPTLNANLDDETWKTIKQTPLEWKGISVDDVTLTYLGTFGEYMALGMKYNVGAWFMEQYETVANIKFTYPDTGEKIKIWGKAAEESAFICTLQEAFDMGLINTSDLKDIAWYMYGTVKVGSNEIGWGEFYTIEHTPTPLMPAELDEATAKRIVQTRADQLGSHVTTDDVWIEKYLGTYNGVVVVDLTRNGWFTHESEYFVGNIVFRNDTCIRCWKKI